MVDDMVSGMGAGVLLDSHLRDMVNLVVDLIANMHSWSSNSMVSSRNNSSSNSGSSLNLNSFDFSRGGSNNMVGNWGSICISGSWNNSRGSLNLNSLDFSNSWSSNNMMGNRGSYSDNWSSMGNGINKTVLIDIFRESFQRKGSIAAVGSNKVTNKRSQRA